MKHTKQNFTTKNSAFTLVELIVVIVILAILATIAFLSFGSQSSSARDSTRLSDLGSISKGLMVYQSNKGSYPTPDRGVNITNSGVSNIIGIQGEVESSVKSNIKAGADGFIDPLNKAPYLYTINKAGNKYRLATFLENKDSVALNLSDSNLANAATYENRFIYLKGDNVAVLYVETGSVITPIQDSPLVSTSTGIDISTGVLAEIVAVTANNTTAVSVSGSSIATTYSATIYPGCDTGDITISSGGLVQTWAACNVGASKASEYTLCTSNNTGACTIERVGNFYEWGRNEIYNSAKGKGSLVGGWTRGGQGVCEVGYHIPTIEEFKFLSDLANSDVNLYIKKLYIPIAGHFHFDDDPTINKSINADIGSDFRFWASTQESSGDGQRLKLQGGLFNLDGGDDPLRANTVRCIKN